MEDFYRAFESKYRGSRDLIKTRLKQYLPFIKGLAEIYGDGLILDLGCGRGEWLELMQELGLTPYGVDIDEGMLQDCFDLNLPVSKADGVEFLKTLKSDSHTAITAFHVVEHLSFENLQIIIQEALRVLKPGGLLIMETPNPENIKVATVNFYIDPTHKRPIPAELLSFIPEYYGFAKIKTLRLQENKELISNDQISLLDVIQGASPDYAVIAQKQASQEVMSLFNELFEKEYGTSLQVLSDKFEKRLSDTEKRLSDTWEFRLLNFSRRFIKGSVAWLTLSPGSRPRRILRRFLIIAKQYVSSKPRIKKIMVRIISLSPKLKARLKMVGNDYSLPTKLSDAEKQRIISSRAQNIFNILKETIKRNNR